VLLMKPSYASVIMLIAGLFFVVRANAQTLQATDSLDQWEAEMLEFEELDKTRNYPPESIFFTGSSSIRLWSTLENDMAPFPVIQRGFGGSRMIDVLRLADRFIAPHTFGSVVLFVANDIIGSELDITPEEVRDQFEEFIHLIRGYNADAPIFVIAITPTRNRWRVWELNQTVNRYLAGLADKHQDVIFVPTEDLFLGSDGLPIESLFVADQLHLSTAGYTLWSKRLRAYLDPVLGSR
jgi:lysophospholipase L1-like esterase